MDWMLGSAGEALDVIELHGITAYGFHGALPEERRTGQIFQADLRLHLDTKLAGDSDDLAHTVDYARVARLAAEVLSGPALNLLESVAARVAKVVLDSETVEVVEVTIHKPNAAVGAEIKDVAVHLRRTAHSWNDSTFVAVDSSMFEAVGEAQRRAGLVSPLFGGELPSGSGRAIEAGGLGAPGVGPDVFQPDVSPYPVLNDASMEFNQFSSPQYLEPARRRRAEPSDWPISTIDQVPDEPADAIIGLGANLGEALATLRSALADLREEPGVEVVAVSPLARTAPVGYKDQPDFFNAVAHVRTRLAPRVLLRTLQGIEDKHGRQQGVRWGPRTLDLDLIAYDTVLADEEELTLPHPRAHERSFVLVPWSLMAPGAFLPGLGGGPVADLAEAAPDQGCIRWLAPDWDRPPVDKRKAQARAEAARSYGAGPGRSAESGAVSPLMEPLPAPSKYPADGPGMPGFFNEARRGHSVFRGLGSEDLDEPLKAVPYQPLAFALGDEEMAEAVFVPRLETGPESHLPYRRSPSQETPRPPSYAVMPPDAPAESRYDGRASWNGVPSRPPGPAAPADGYRFDEGSPSGLDWRGPAGRAPTRMEQMAAQSPSPMSSVPGGSGVPESFAPQSGRGAQSVISMPRLISNGEVDSPRQDSGRGEYWVTPAPAEV
ncbi:MAG: 2-amino-4-hydroxy-6-hydroxymethyldihydropteridine diphosphokinase [Bifidobacteriaceae bacterium]|jgi:dihydroneopterin aldolase/2-amino-4-hydroxy-6-hydroxymethyldihydropteridine diphosphokinase|nr:2-amino-4-hydroxy-6-hydroxymethyldihydropteridine diphosphokinase [Bifidobacteriaceae bacterium]